MAFTLHALAEALHAYTQALNASIDDPAALGNRCLLFLHLGRVFEALQDGQRCLQACVQARRGKEHAATDLCSMCR